jgi:hypothetical protein
VKIDKILPSIKNKNNPFSHVFIIRNKDNTKQKKITTVPPRLEIAYCSGQDGTDPEYDIFSYKTDEHFDDMSIKIVRSKQMYIAWTTGFQELLDKTKPEDVPKEDVPKGGGARRKSKNVKRSRSKSRKSRKQRKSNKNRRTKYYKK